MTNRLWMGIAAAAFLAAPAAAAEPQVGQRVTNFKLTDANGRNVELADYRGRVVVLEWHNPGCPYVKKHYDSGNMQRTQAAAIADGAVWLTINSGAQGQQGHMTGPEARRLLADQRSNPTAYLLDPRGVVGRGYGAVTTPHLYIIDGEGTLRYKGGIDDKPTNRVEDIKDARNHVTAALAEMKAGRDVSVADTRPYGCTVKYAS